MINEKIQTELNSVMDFTPPYIKLIKNTRGVNWEVKIFEGQEISQKTIDELKKVNSKMHEIFEVGINEDEIKEEDFK